MTKTVRPSNLLLIVACLVLTRGAASQPVGEFPAKEAPQLVPSGELDKSGRELLTWDKPGAFGKVPADKRILGNATCITASADLEAIGYHPQAKDRSGREMPGGGFFCSVKADGDRPAATPPRLTEINGIWGWDNPAAFGAVPADLKSRGDTICRRTASHLEAVAYHPLARSAQNEPIFGGGFFCGPRKQGSLALEQEAPIPAQRLATKAVESAPAAQPVIPVSPAPASPPSPLELVPSAAKPVEAAAPSAAKPVETAAPSAAKPVEAAATVSSPASADSPTEIKSISAGFYVQHASSAKRTVVERFWRNNPSIREARLVELTRIGAEGPNFVLLSGPFSSLSEALNFANQTKLPKENWVREASKIRPLLPIAR